MKIAIYGRNFGDKSLPFVKEVLQVLHNAGVQVVIYQPFYQLITQQNIDVSFAETFSDHKTLAGADYLLSLGGDGTLLDTVTLVRDSGLPVLGINLGRLGFLASINKKDIAKAIESLLNKEFSIDRRDLLSLHTPTDLFGGLNYALNEMCIHKRDGSSMIIVHAYLNGEFLNSYWADGLIVSTPTGSTAYSLSCGGPIIVPHSSNFVITPICPHNLSVRPIIINDDSELVFEVDGRASEFLVSLDSRTEIAGVNIKLTIKKAQFGINLIRLHNESFLNTLRNKLMWGLDSRNY